MHESEEKLHLFCKIFSIYLIFFEELNERLFVYRLIICFSHFFICFLFFFGVKQKYLVLLNILNGKCR